MKTLNILLTVITFTLCSNLRAEITNYESFENKGLNKQERIEVIDKYLVNLATSLKNMENKLDENSKKLKSLEDVVKVIKADEQKKLEQQLGEKTITPSLASKDINETEKLKADILSLKNDDIEKIKVDFQELKDTVKAMQSVIKSTVKK